MVAEKWKWVNVISKVLHQAGCICMIELCQTVNLIHLSDIPEWGVGRVEREKRGPRRKIWFVSRFRKQRVRWSQ